MKRSVGSVKTSVKKTSNKKIESDVTKDRSFWGNTSDKTRIKKQRDAIAKANK